MIELHSFSREDFSRLIGWADSPEFLMQWAGPIFTHPWLEIPISGKSFYSFVAKLT